MKILQLAGTSDARQLAIELKRQGFDVLTTVVTSNAAIELEASGLQVLVGRLTDSDLFQLIKERKINIVVDASHPYAEEASKNAIKAAEMAEIPYIRFERPSQQFDDDLIIKVDSYEEAAELAAKKQGNIMLTTGSKTLQIFTDKLLPLPNTRVIARMLPRKDNMEKCEGLGLPQKNIIAIQGPFTKDFNKALFKQFEVTLMVTKESGKEGAVDEKVEAASELGIETILIKRPRIQYGITYSTVEDVINHIKGVENNGI
ncbi:precorrin-6A reductase [Schinkia azotoformans]|uniref:precorrin-6A reductase n=1 Tax=Schinkia azotoformans TaxID=1454 RepID=UPI002DC03E1D|nr:precorrin-6A reductase [Schinkia azotoformans]MEC1721558.1 precorrin-6A reductase [Schinkia azotoformans]MED4413643.1 precorrin-6A reductase [Schinkia azotoformans]